MQAFTTHAGAVVPLDRVNVDTDQIIPKQYLKSIKRTGFGDYLFDGWRFNDEGHIGMTPNERQINHEFVLNRPEFQGASVLLARDNFGCGSSREHAVWALQEFGFRVVIAPSYADIFYGNCFKNGLLPVVLNEEAVDDLFASAGPNVNLSIDLGAQTVTTAQGEVHNEARADEFTEYFFVGTGSSVFTAADGTVESILDWQSLKQLWLETRAGAA